MYHNSYYLNCKQTNIAEIHVRFHGHIPVFLVVVYITTDESTVYGDSSDYKEQGSFATFFGHQKQRPTFLHFVLLQAMRNSRQTYFY